MNLFKRIYCRVYQLGFRIAMPLLPYRDPKILTSVGELAVYLKEQGRTGVLIVTDPELYRLGMTKSLEDALSAQGIALGMEM
mgnify:CR=1 FL=1